MAYFFKIWKEGLYELKREDLIVNTARVPLTFVRIDSENAHKVTAMRGREYERQFRAQLKMGDIGYWACVDGEPVGYGWYKTAGSKDYFFKIGEGCCYMARHFVSEEMRGKGVHPAILSKLVELNPSDDLFYLCIERSNIPSQKSCAKVGFKKIGELKFLRILKYTFNKKHLPL